MRWVNFHVLMPLVSPRQVYAAPVRQQRIGHDMEDDDMLDPMDCPECGYPADEFYEKDDYLDGEWVCPVCGEIQ